jgi:hypothetical protein
MRLLSRSGIRVGSSNATAVVADMSTCNLAPPPSGLQQPPNRGVAYADGPCDLLAETGMVY